MNANLLKYDVFWGGGVKKNGIIFNFEKFSFQSNLFIHWCGKSSVLVYSTIEQCHLVYCMWIDLPCYINAQFGSCQTNMVITSEVNDVSRQTSAPYHILPILPCPISNVKGPGEALYGAGINRGILVGLHLIFQDFSAVKKKHKHVDSNMHIQ